MLTLCPACNLRQNSVKKLGNYFTFIIDRGNKAQSWFARSSLFWISIYPSTAVSNQTSLQENRLSLRRMAVSYPPLYFLFTLFDSSPFWKTAAQQTAWLSSIVCLKKQMTRTKETVAPVATLEIPKNTFPVWNAGDRRGVSNRVHHP